MNRICEEVQYLDVFAPQAVATATDKASAFVDTAGVDSVEFLIYTGALTSGRQRLQPGGGGRDGIYRIRLRSRTCRGELQGPGRPWPLCGRHLPA